MARSLRVPVYDDGFRPAVALHPVRPGVVDGRPRRLVCEWIRSADGRLVRVWREPRGGVERVAAPSE